MVRSLDPFQIPALNALTVSCYTQRTSQDRNCAVRLSLPDHHSAIFPINLWSQSIRFHLPLETETAYSSRGSGDQRDYNQWDHSNLVGRLCERYGDQCCDEVCVYGAYVDGTMVMEMWCNFDHDKHVATVSELSVRYDQYSSANMWRMDDSMICPYPRGAHDCCDEVTFTGGIMECILNGVSMIDFTEFSFTEFSVGPKRNVGKPQGDPNGADGNTMNVGRIAVIGLLGVLILLFGIYGIYLLCKWCAKEEQAQDPEERQYGDAVQEVAQEMVDESKKDQEMEEKH